MAEEISDNQFKSEMLEFKSDMLEFKTEVMRFVDVAEKKFDGITSDVRTNSFKMDRLETKINGLETNVEKLSSTVNDLSSDVKTLSSQFKDVGVMAIKNHKRIDNLEERVDVLEAEVH